MSDYPSETEEGTGTSRGALSSMIYGNELGLVAKQLERRIPLKPSDLASCVTICKEIMADPQAPRRTRLMAIRVMSLMHGQNQSDVHHVESLDHAREKLAAEQGITRLKMERAEQGKPNDSLAIVAPVVNQLPLPDYLRKRAGLSEGVS